jgi:hypothetical protein
MIDELYFQLVKQTTNNPSIESVLAVMDMFTRVATVFPCSLDAFKWIMAHLVRLIMGTDPRVTKVAIFSFIRLHGRFSLHTVFDYVADPRILTLPLGQVMTTVLLFGVPLYELLQAQRARFPNLPVPFVLHFMVELVKTRGGLQTEGIFRNPGNDAQIREIRTKVNFGLNALERGDVDVVASLIKMWLFQLANPLVPLELLPRFIELGSAGSFREFFALLPTAHRRTLLYFAGFLLDVARNSEKNGLSTNELATLFGPCFVNPSRSGSTDPSEVQKLTLLSIGLCKHILEEQDTTIFYPLHQLYLATPAPKA